MTIPAAGHDYGTPTYEWNAIDGGFAVTAMAVCVRDASHVVTETVNATYAVVTEPGCETTGIGLYTATFTNVLFTTQTSEAPIPALGHDYQLTGWSWTGSDDAGWTGATVTFTCSHDAAHV